MAFGDDECAVRALDLSPSVAAEYIRLLRTDVASDGVPVGVLGELVRAGLADDASGELIHPGTSLAAARRRALASIEHARSTVRAAFGHAASRTPERLTSMVRGVNARHALASAASRLRDEDARVCLMEGPLSAPPTRSRAGLVAQVLAQSHSRVVHRGGYGNAGAGYGFARPGVPTGPRSRVAGDSPLRMLMVDDARPTAWVWHEDETPHPPPVPPQVLQVSAPALLTVLRATFDAAWAGGVRPPEPHAIGTTGAVSDADVLAALAGGLSDEDAARAVGLSLRTFARRVSGLMRATGSATRFQLALAAERAGVL